MLAIPAASPSYLSLFMELGPVFLLLLFSCRSAGQETVNTHSAAPTHKSEQRAALYIQIRDGRGRKVEGKKRKGGKKKKKREKLRTSRLGGEGSVLPERQPKVPAGAGGQPAALLPPPPAGCASERGIGNVPPSPTPPCLYRNRCKIHFITFGATKLNQRFRGLSLLQTFVGLFSPPPAPRYFISSTSEAFKGTVVPPRYCFSVPRS